MGSKLSFGLYKWSTFFKLAFILNIICHAPCWVASLVFLLECLFTTNCVFRIRPVIVITGSCLEVDIFQIHLHGNHLCLVQNVNKLRTTLEVFDGAAHLREGGGGNHSSLVRNHVTDSALSPSLEGYFWRQLSEKSSLQWEGASPRGLLGSCDKATQNIDDGIITKTRGNKDKFRMRNDKAGKRTGRGMSENDEYLCY